MGSALSFFLVFFYYIKKKEKLEKKEEKGLFSPALFRRIFAMVFSLGLRPKAPGA